MKSSIPNSNSNNNINKPRSILDPIILTTLPHFLATIFVLDCHHHDITRNEEDILLFIYAYIIIISTTLSIFWHRSRESYGVIFTLDYIFALLWTSMEIVLSFLYLSSDQVADVILFNLAVMLLNKVGDKLSSYRLAHSMWHLLNVAKASYVAKEIGTGAKCNILM
jgi:hypothetical protein